MRVLLLISICIVVGAEGNGLNFLSKLLGKKLLQKLEALFVSKQSHLASKWTTKKPPIDLPVNAYEGAYPAPRPPIQQQAVPYPIPEIPEFYGKVVTICNGVCEISYVPVCTTNGYFSAIFQNECEFIKAQFCCPQKFADWDIYGYGTCVNQIQQDLIQPIC